MLIADDPAKGSQPTAFSQSSVVKCPRPGYSFVTQSAPASSYFVGHSCLGIGLTSRFTASSRPQVNWPEWRVAVTKRDAVYEVAALA